VWASNETDTGIWCDEWFYVWNDSFLEEDCFITDELGNCIPFCEACLCDQIQGGNGPPEDEYHIIGPGHRGWLNFPRPEEPAPVPECADNCGSNLVACWIGQAGGYPGPITINPNILGHDLCLPGEPGVSESVRHEIYVQMGTNINLLIWDDQPCTEEMIVGECPGIPYHIVDWGCIQVDPVDPTPEIDIPANPEYLDQPWCMQNVKVILASRNCPCTTGCEGIPTGQP
jgi:hypothetical protein